VSQWGAARDYTENHKFVNGRPQLTPMVMSPELNYGWFLLSPEGIIEMIKDIK